MRALFSQYLLALLVLSAALSGAIPTALAAIMRFNQSSTYGTDAFFTEQDIKDLAAGGAALRKIDWKIVKGGLKWGYKRLTLFLTATDVALTIMGCCQKDSNHNSSEPIRGRQYSDDGTQGSIAFIADAIENAWNAVTDKKYDHACMDLSDGDTWHGRLAIATTSSGVDVETFGQGMD